MAQPFKPQHFLAPRYWGTWLALLILRLLVLLPWRAQQRIGSLLGLLAYALAKKRRQIAKINIDLCFSEKSPQQRAAMLKAHFESVGKAILEVGMFWYMPAEKYQKIATLTGREHLDAAIQKGNVLLLGVHFTCLEAGVRLLNDLGYCMQGMYKPAHNALFDAFMAKKRAEHYQRGTGTNAKGGMVANNQARVFISRLAKGQLSWFAPDQSFAEHVVDAPFFGIHTSSLTSTQHIARATGAQVLPMFGFRTKTGYQVHVLPPLHPFPTGDDIADTTLVNQAMEQMIAYAPEQYLWAHRRFKHQADGTQYYP